MLGKNGVIELGVDFNNLKILHSGRGNFLCHVAQDLWMSWRIDAIGHIYNRYACCAWVGTIMSSPLPYQTFGEPIFKKLWIVYEYETQNPCIEKPSDEFYGYNSWSHYQRMSPQQSS